MKKDYIAIEIDIVPMAGTGVFLTSAVGVFKLEWLNEDDLGGEELWKQEEE